MAISNAQTLLGNWKERGRYLTIAEKEIFLLTAGDEKNPPLLILHGFPSFSYDFHAVLPALSEQFYVVIHDHPGFGLSGKPLNYSYSLIEQAEVAIALWQELGIRRGHLLGHDYGTSVASEILARREQGSCPVALDSVTLCNGSVHIELSKLLITQKILRNHTFGPILARLVSKRFTDARLRNLWGDRSRAKQEDLDVLWEAANYRDGRMRLPKISQYLRERVTFWHRWIGALERLDIPAHILWGKKDPIAVPIIAEQLEKEIPNSQLTWLNDLGHYPMLEDPEAWASAALAFWEKLK